MLKSHLYPLLTMPMDIDLLPFRKTGYFSDFICDYLDENENLRPLYHNFPSTENFKDQIAQKATTFSQTQRDVLYEVLQKQYHGFTTSKATINHIKQLKEPITFTIVTGHQLNLFTGPLYFLYKIVSTINLTKELKQEYPEYNFVPIYWMATEDHDFDEINYFNFRGKKLRWNKDASGAVGHLDTKGLEAVLATFSKAIDISKNAEELKALFNEAYLKHNTLTDATRYLANELFGAYGLVIIDGDDTLLKKQLVPYMKKDIFDKIPYKEVGKTIDYVNGLPEKYGIQVNPREINYFYLREGLRERIVEADGIYAVHGEKVSWSASELLEEIHDFPERFSPNVIARPLFQEVILPNLCYIGGGGELAYWLELKAMFGAMQVPFPILLLRNSALIITKKQHEKLRKMGLSIEDLFLDQSSFINKKIREISNIDIDFSPQKKILKEQFEALFTLAEQTDKSFLGAVKAQEVKQKKGLDHLEKRLLKAQKRKLKDHVARMTQIQNELFPGKSLQERNLNFSELYLEMGPDLIPTLLNALKPLSLNFTILTSK